jgi:hypothetical protein
LFPGAGFRKSCVKTLAKSPAVYIEGFFNNDRFWFGKKGLISWQAGAFHRLLDFKTPL